ncbi:MAG: DUF4340 domain-containing protein [Polyangiaceae bacterium]|nr:DUF4340 domain-containing protein [Polyangiaceae bacterium]
MKTETKLIIALVALAALVGGWFMFRAKDKKDEAAHAPTAASADLPGIALPKDDGDKVTKLEIKNADKSNVTLEKKGDTWEVTAPVSAKAEQSNVKSLIDNLKELKIKESITKGADLYAQYDLTDEKALHVVAYKGAEKAVDLYFGKSGSRGQVMRIGGKDGVYIAEKYSSFQYTRDVKSWRERTILKFEDANAIQVTVENKNGFFSFSKNDDKWSASVTLRDKDGKLNKDPEKKWEKFEPEKVKDLLRAYKALNAEDFGDDKSDTGFANAASEGGVVKIKLKDNAGDYTVTVGKNSKGSSRFAKKDGSDVIFTISSWSADWATAAMTKFEKGEKKDEKHDDGPPDDGADPME